MKQKPLHVQAVCGGRTASLRNKPLELRLSACRLSRSAWTAVAEPTAWRLVRICSLLT
jgi:hypothetical protein